MIRIGVYSYDGSTFRFIGWEDLTGGTVGGVDVRRLTGSSGAALAGSSVMTVGEPVLVVDRGGREGGGNAPRVLVIGAPGRRVRWETSVDGVNWERGGEVTLGDDGTTTLETRVGPGDASRFFRLRTPDPN